MRNPMELYHNQVTRVQGPFSLRLFHRSWGLMLIQANLDAPCTLLDFPTLERFVEEIRGRPYDIVGISGIVPNFLKVKKMCELVRAHLPQAQIIVGGHVANIPDLAERIDADHVVRGEGVGWFRRFLGEDPEKPIRHPQIIAGHGTRTVGLKAPEKTRDMAATVIPSVGCPIGCNFCSTSAMFGGKGRSVPFYRTGDELFDIMCQLEANLKVQSFFMMDENFLLNRTRALRLLELMERHDKAWALYLFSSASVLRSYRIEQLVRLGLTWVWMGLEGEQSRYAKLQGIDTRALVRRLQANGIRVLGSTIIGLENHTPENIAGVIEHAVRHDTDFHQFMLYTPLPGTPLHAELSAQGRMKDESEYDISDIHGQSLFNYRHPHIRNGLETELIVRAFERDFAVNGPSVARLARTILAGWKRYKNHADPRVRRRFAWEARDLAGVYSAVVAAARLHYRGNPALRAKMDALLADLHREFGLKSRFYAAVGGPYVLWKMRREEARLARGWTYEPPTFYERNEAAQRSASLGGPQAALCQGVTCRAKGLPSVEAAAAGLPEPLAIA
ncbi:MAG: cobalamin-dependent protein [Thermoguttaceae bacterium]